MTFGNGAPCVDVLMQGIYLVGELYLDNISCKMYACVKSGNNKTSVWTKIESVTPVTITTDLLDDQKIDPTTVDVRKFARMIR